MEKNGKSKGYQKPELIKYGKLKNITANSGVWGADLNELAS